MSYNRPSRLGVFRSVSYERLPDCERSPAFAAGSFQACVLRSSARMTKDPQPLRLGVSGLRPTIVCQNDKRSKPSRLGVFRFLSYDELTVHKWEAYPTGVLFSGKVAIASQVTFTGSALFDGGSCRLSDRLRVCLPFATHPFFGTHFSIFALRTPAVPYPLWGEFAQKFRSHRDLDPANRHYNWTFVLPLPLSVPKFKYYSYSRLSPPLPAVVTL